MTAPTWWLAQEFAPEDGLEAASAEELRHYPETGMGLRH